MKPPHTRVFVSGTSLANVKLYENASLTDIIWHNFSTEET